MCVSKVKYACKNFLDHAQTTYCKRIVNNLVSVFMERIRVDFDSF